MSTNQVWVLTHLEKESSKSDSRSCDNQAAHHNHQPSDIHESPHSTSHLSHADDDRSDPHVDERRTENICSGWHEWCAYNETHVCNTLFINRSVCWVCIAVIMPLCLGLHLTMYCSCVWVSLLHACDLLCDDSFDVIRDWDATFASFLNGWIDFIMITPRFERASCRDIEVWLALDKQCEMAHLEC